MAPGNVNFGDAEAAVVDIVHADAGVNALGTVTVATDLRGYAAGQQWVQVRRTGGIPTLWMQLDNPEITIDVRAADKGAALDLSEAVRSAVFVARNAYTGRGLWLYDVVDLTGLTWTPDDKQPTVARYVFALTLVTRPV